MHKLTSLQTGANNYGGGGKHEWSVSSRLNAWSFLFEILIKRLPITREICVQSEPLSNLPQSIELFRLAVTRAYILTYAHRRR